MQFQRNQYRVQGIRLTDLAEEFGTALYVYDSERMVQQYQRMVKAFDVPSLAINYACKANANLSILRLFEKLGAGLDTVSAQEIRLGLEAGFTPERIIYTPNSVGMAEIERAINLGARINIDNIEMLERIGQKYPGHPFCIRINPHIMAGGHHHISVGHIDSKFGISIHQMPLVERIVQTLDLNIEGVHMHTGSDILDTGVFLRAADILFDVARKFDKLQYIDFGSGFKVPYKPDDIATDIEGLGREMGKRFNEFCKEYGRPLTLMFEPGKFLVSEAGYFLAKVNVVKQTTSTIFAGVDSGFNHLIRPMFYDAYHEIVNLSNPKGEKRIYSVVGYICETDTFGWNRMLNEVRPGDILCLKNAGAYCMSMASNYNSRYRPAEVLIHKGQAHLVRRREEFDDLIRNQVMMELEV